MWLTLTVASELIMRALRVRFSYLFFQTPGFDDLGCQSEARRVFNTFVHLAKAAPEREGDESHSGPS